MFAIVTTFPAVVYTVLLGAAVVYWLFVMIGAIHLDHADGAADGIADGLDHGHGVDASGGDGHEAHGLAGIMEALKLRSAPASVVLSVVVLFSWIFSVLGAQAAAAVLPAPSPVLGAAKLAVFVLAPVLALFPTSIAIRPLAKLFAPPKAVASKDLIGQVCTVRTGTVTDRFGEATLEDGGAGVVVRVRVESGEKLSRGQQAVIVGYDDARHEFTVAPMDVLEDEEAVGDAKKAGSRRSG